MLYIRLGSFLVLYVVHLHLGESEPMVILRPLTTAPILEGYIYTPVSINVVGITLEI